MIIKKLHKVLTQFSIIPKTTHKPYIIIIFELIFWIIANRGGINVYFEYELFLKGKKQRDYIKPYQFKRIENKLNTPKYYPILEDKYFFHQILVGQGYRVPRSLYLIDHSSVFNLESKTYINEEEFLLNNLDGFCKVINGFGGLNIYRFAITDKKLALNDNELSISDLFTFLGNRKFIIQERIIQHKDMNAINPSSINTLRMLTFKIGQTVHFYNLYLRIGINNNYVDNCYSGNIMIGVHKDTGKLFEYAYSNEHDTIQYKMDRHPQTNKVFKDYSIPFYKESVEMVKSLHVLFQQFFMIGWDIGITPEGPIVLEGNNITELYSYQVIYGGLKSSFYELAKAYQSKQ
jgi:hypothetical protein